MPGLTFWLRMLLSLAVLMAVWLVWSGFLTPLLLSLGAVSCALVLLLSVRMGAFQENSDWLRLLPRLPAFWLWLGKEVVKSNFAMARAIWSRHPPRSPTVVTIRALPESRLGQAILGNCITLTPGTLTIDDHDGELSVHCFDAAGATNLLEGEMNRRVARLTRR